VRKAASEQSTTASEISKATESMQRGAMATTRALAQQATASDEIADLWVVVGGVCGLLPAKGADA
jgi:hypothetical protein